MFDRPIFATTDLVQRTGMARRSASRLLATRGQRTTAAPSESQRFFRTSATLGHLSTGRNQQLERGVTPRDSPRKTPRQHNSGQPSSLGIGARCTTARMGNRLHETPSPCGERCFVVRRANPGCAPATDSASPGPYSPVSLPRLITASAGATLTRTPARSDRQAGLFGGVRVSRATPADAASFLTKNKTAASPCLVRAYGRYLRIVAKPCGLAKYPLGESNPCCRTENPES